MRRLAYRTVCFVGLGLLTSCVVAAAAVIWIDPMTRSEESVELLRTDHGPVYVVGAKRRAISVYFHAPIRSVYPTPLRPDAGRLEIDAWSRQLGHDQLRDDSRAPQWSHPDATWPPPTDGGAYLTLAAGWPLRCFAGTAELTPAAFDSPSDLHWAFQLAGGLGRDRPQYPRLFPLRPLALGLLTNVLVYTAIWMSAVASLAAARRILRRARGRCPACGYDVRHTPNARCPECGIGERTCSVA